MLNDREQIDGIIAKIDEFVQYIKEDVRPVLKLVFDKANYRTETNYRLASAISSVIQQIEFNTRDYPRVINNIREDDGKICLPCGRMKEDPEKGLCNSCFEKEGKKENGT